MRKLYFWNPRNNENADHYISNIFTKLNWDKMYLIYLIFKFFTFPETDLIWQNLHRFEFARTANIRQNVNLEFFIPQIVFLLQLYLPSIKKIWKGIIYIFDYAVSMATIFIIYICLKQSYIKNINVYKLQLILFSLDIAFYNWQGLPKKQVQYKTFSMSIV